VYVCGGTFNSRLSTTVYWNSDPFLSERTYRERSSSMSSSGGGRVGNDAKHDCLPPRQTGRADFPHPAFTQTLAAQQYAGTQGRLSSAAKPRSKMRTVPNLRAGFRRGTRAQAEFPPSDSACLRPGRFAPRSLPASLLSALLAAWMGKPCARRRLPLAPRSLFEGRLVCFGSRLGNGG
jgi:hypothetical protein